MLGQTGSNAAELLKADRRLVDQCLSGQESAWARLFDLCHGVLLAAVRKQAGAGRCGEEFAEEIASRIWFCLTQDGGRLLDRFDPTKGCRLTTYVASLARHEILTYLRSEGRRQRREQRKAMTFQDMTCDEGEDGLNRQIVEFLGTLTPRERQFCETQLLAAGNVSVIFSETNAWQLRSRVRRKLEAYLETKHMSSSRKRAAARS